MLPHPLNLTVRLKRQHNDIDDSTVPSHMRSSTKKGRRDLPDTNVPRTQETTTQDIIDVSSSEGEDHTQNEDCQSCEDAQKQIVLYDPAANSAGEIESAPIPINCQPPYSLTFPFPNQTPRVLPSVGAFTVQCANCFKWRLIPTQEKYEEIREHILELPFMCETAREWRPEISCDDPPDIVQDNSRLWAIDKPNIAQPPRGWQRQLRIRGEGSTKFADVYYVAPSGKMLRSTVEIQRYLEKHPEYVEEGVCMSQFSFQIPKPLREDYVRKYPSRLAASHKIINSNNERLIGPEVRPIAWANPDS